MEDLQKSKELLQLLARAMKIIANTTYIISSLIQLIILMITYMGKIPWLAVIEVTIVNIIMVTSISISIKLIANSKKNYQPLDIHRRKGIF